MPTSSRQDNYGNQTVQSFGPVYVDTVHTPDHAPLAGADGRAGWRVSRLDGQRLHAARQWIAREPTRLSHAALDQPQKFYATWDLSSGQEGGHLRLAWEGANWDYDGDSIRLPLGAGQGTTSAYHPFTPTRPITLPAPANYPDLGAGQPDRRAVPWDDGVAKLAGHDKWILLSL